MQLIRSLSLYLAIPLGPISSYLIHQGTVNGSRKLKAYGYALLAIFSAISIAVGIPSMIDMINIMMNRTP